MSKNIFTSAPIIEERFADVCNLKASPEPPLYSDFRHDHVPNWLRLKILASGLNRGRYASTSGWSVLQSARWEFGGLWLDHVGSAVIGGVRLFVSQPYGLYKTSLRELLAFCRGVGVDCIISPCSQWNPGATVSVIIIPSFSDVYFASERVLQTAGAGA